MSNETTPKPEETVRLYNRSDREFQHGTHKARRTTFCTVPKSVADVWLKGYPNDIVLASDAQKEINGAQAELVDTKAKLDAALKELEELKAKSGGKKSSKADTGI